MKGHLKNGHGKGMCRPNPRVEHGNNNKECGGKYEWETQRWTGSEWKPVPSVENKVVVQTTDTGEIQTIHSSSILRAPPPGRYPETRDAFLAPIRGAPAEADTKSGEADTETPPEPTAGAAQPVTETEEEWKPLASEYWFRLYQNWQWNSLTVPFPTRVGMTSLQLGDIMENYSKYRKYYR